MKKTLYDLLGVPLAASRDQIAAAYERLQHQHDPDAPQNRGNPDADIQLKAAREAFLVLSSQDQREAYDASLAHRTLEVPRNTNKLLIYGLSGLIGFAVISQAVVQWQARRMSKQAMEQNQAEAIERERMQSFGEDMNPRTFATREEAERQRSLAWEEDERQRQARYEEQRQQREMEAARSYGARVSSELSRSEAAARRQAEYEHQRLEGEQRYEQERREREALQRLEAEKRRLRQLEYQNRR
jgi:DnaJ-class molecular chaperone